MKTLVTTGALCLLLFSCGPAAEEKAKLEAQRLLSEDNAETRLADSLAASMVVSELNPNNPLHQQVARTAYLRIEVDELKLSNSLIEKWVADEGGLITSSKLNHDVLEVVNVPSENDSVIQKKRIQSRQEIQLKIPQAALNKFLFHMDSIAAFTEQRELSAENLGLEILDKKLTVSRLSAADSKIVKPKTEVSTLLAQDVLIERKAQSDEAVLSGIKLQNRVDYSDIKLEIYEPQKIVQRLIPQSKPLHQEPGVFDKIGQALFDGWKILEWIILFLIRTWSLGVLGILFLVLMKRYRRKKGI